MQASQLFYFACLAAGLTPSEARAEERKLVASVRAEVRGRRLTAKSAKDLAVRCAG